MVTMGSRLHSPAQPERDDLDVFQAVLFDPVEDQGIQFVGPCSDPAGPHVKVDPGPIPTLAKGETESGLLLDRF